MGPLQGAFLSPGKLSTWRLQRHWLQWFRWVVPKAWLATVFRHLMQRNVSGSAMGTDVTVTRAVVTVRGGGGP